MKVQKWLSLGDAYTNPRLKKESKTLVSGDKVIESLKTPHLVLQVAYGDKGVKHQISAIKSKERRREKRKKERIKKKKNKRKKKRKENFSRQSLFMNFTSFLLEMPQQKETSNYNHSCMKQ